MLSEKKFAVEVEQYLKDIGLSVVQTEVGIGKRRIRPDLVGYSLTKAGDLAPKVVVEIKLDQDYLKGQQQLMYYAQHLGTAPYALLVTPDRKVWYDAETFLQIEQPTFESESEFFIKESDISETIKSAVEFLKSTGMFSYDILWTMCFSFFVRVHLHSKNRLSDWKSIKTEPDFLFMVNSAFENYEVGRPIKNFEVKPQNLKPEEMQQLVSILSLVPPHHEILKKTLFSLIEDIGAKYAGSYLTPVHLRKLFTGLAQQLNLNKKDGIDLSAGFGGLAFEILDSVPVQSLTAIELNHEIWTISKIISIICGYKNIEVIQANALFSNGETLSDTEKYSCVFVDPPLGKTTIEEPWYDLYLVAEKRKRVEFTELFIERAIELAKEDGEGYIIALVPEGILFNSTNQIIRDLIKRQTIIEAIISLPVQTLRPYSGVKLSVLVLRKKTNENETASNLFIAQPNNIDEFEEVVKGFAEWKRGTL